MNYSTNYNLNKPERNEQFKHDYINYVLDYLDYYYPEIEWVGGM